MRVFGIICEYNPFHRGHKWQIDELRRLAGEEECAVVCAMSGGNSAETPPLFAP